MDTVKNWKDIIDNLRQFSYVTKYDNTFTLAQFSFFFHWYYFPQDDLFAPSKFLGYRQTKINEYSGKGWGGVTQGALEKYFDKLPKDSKRFKQLFAKLENYASSIGKSINTRTLNGIGGIYIPKNEYDKSSEYSQKLFNISAEDIAALQDEENSAKLEGEKKSKLVNIYERNPSLRARAIKLHGLKCHVCKFDFAEKYGSHGKDFIEVHHLKPLHQLVDPSLIDPKIDMTVLCANCHRMIHRKKNQPLTIEELKELWEKYSS